MVSVVPDHGRGGSWYGKTRGLGVLAGRILLACAVVGLGLWVLASLHRTDVRPQAVSQRPPGSSPPWPAWDAPFDLEGGAWTIAGLPWRVQVYRMPRPSAEAALKKCPAETSPAGQGNRQERELLSLAKALKPQALTENGCVVYHLSLAQVKVALFASGAGEEERLVLGRILCPGEDETANLIEAMPMPPDQEKEGPSHDLLSLPTGFRRLATRRSPTGAVIADLALVDNDATRLCEFWRQQGYQTAPTFERDGKTRGIACWREGQAVQAWLWPCSEGGGQTMVLQIVVPAETRK